MRKLILLALAWGTYEYLRRDAERNGSTVGTTLAAKFAAWIHGPDAPAAPPEN
jgi:hypothetical protein